MPDAPPFAFEVLARCPSTRARAGRLATPHGPVETPAFMPVGTRASVKGILPRDLAEAGSRMVLANTYHLHLRPGEAVVSELGGLHRFMAWDGPILTDSGGFQVFSLAHLTRVDEDGATLGSIVDGSDVRLSPERVVEVQAALGADVAMAFDHCPSDPGDRASVEAATERTHRWLARCVRRHAELDFPYGPQALFGIVQGGAFEDLRARSVEAVCAHDLPGYAIGGVSVGEDREAITRTVAATAPRLPEDRPRYLMGVGTPRDFFDAVAAGVDLFDCVSPTRMGRSHQAYTWREGRVNLRNARFARDDGPLCPECSCTVCARFSRGYLRHLCTTGEMLGGALLSLHNLHLFHALLAKLRAAAGAEGVEALRTAALPGLEGRAA